MLYEPIRSQDCSALILIKCCLCIFRDSTNPHCITERSHGDKVVPKQTADQASNQKPPFAQVCGLKFIKHSQCALTYAEFQCIEVFPKGCLHYEGMTQNSGSQLLLLLGYEGVKVKV